MRIGIITALAEETLPIYSKIGTVVEQSIIAGVSVHSIETNNDKIYLACSGAGEIRAAQATQMLIDIFDVDAILNFGFVGSLNQTLNIGDLVIPEKAVHSAFDCRFIDGTRLGQYDRRSELFFFFDENLISYARNVLPVNTKLVTLSSEDAFIASKEKKQELRKLFGADICDMESIGILLVCERNNVPAFSLKVVSDSADNEANQDFKTTLENGITKYDQYIPAIINAIDGYSARRSLPPIKKRN